MVDKDREKAELIKHLDDDDVEVFWMADDLVY